MSEQLKPFEAGGVKWHVTVDRDGHFTATADGYASVSGCKYADLESQARDQAARARVKVHVPYVRPDWKLDRPVLVSGIATGIHAANGNLLLAENGRTAQGGRAVRGCLKPMSHDDAARYLELVQQERDIKVASDEIARKYRFESISGLRGAVEDAVKAARRQAAGESDD